MRLHLPGRGARQILLVSTTALAALLMGGPLGAGVAAPVPHGTGALPVGTLSASTTGAGHWSNLTPATDPGQISWVATTYLPTVKAVLMFGGQNSSGMSNATWEYRAKNWVQILTTSAPSPRQGAALAYDPAIGASILYGGEFGNAGMNDTWEFSGSNWTQLHPATSPPPLVSEGMVYDPAIGGLLLFGGTTNHCCGGAGSSGTWEFVHGNWKQLSPSHYPPAVNEFGMTYDVARSAVVLYGGWDPNSQGLPGSAWQFANGNWSQLSVPKSLTPRQGTGMAYDPLLREAVLYGGATKIPDSNQTFVLNATGIYLDTPSGHSPGRIAYVAMLYDPALKGILLYGGSTEKSSRTATWLFQ